MSDPVKTIKPEVKIIKIASELIKEYDNTKNHLNSKSFKLNNGNSIWCCHEPFMNCQIYSIAAMNQVLAHCKEERIVLLKEIYSKNGKAMFICDIHRPLEEKLEECFPKEHVVFKQKYTSTNNSLMTIFLIKTNTLK